MGNVDGSVGGHLPCLRVGSVGFWLLKSEDAQQDAWEEEDRRNREYLAARHREQDGNYGRHAAMR